MRIEANCGYVLILSHEELGVLEDMLSYCVTNNTHHEALDEDDANRLYAVLTTIRANS